MHNRSRKLARALEHVPGIDIVAFAAALKSWNPSVDHKVCNAVLDGGINNRGYCVPRKVRDSYDRIWRAILADGPQSFFVDVRDRSCDDWGLGKYVCEQSRRMWKNRRKMHAEKVRKYWGNWEDELRVRSSYLRNGLSTLYSDVTSAAHWPMKGYVQGVRDATQIGEGVVNTLTQEEKAEVAKILMRVVEGAEVVAIRAITTTSVMINACYDLFSEGIGIVPYACVGVGGNFVGVVDGFVTPKLAYRVKAGLSYQLTPEISAFVGGYYHRIVGDGSYEDLPTKRLADDLSPAGRTKDTAVANFSMAYAGAELGVRFLF